MEVVKLTKNTDIKVFEEVAILHRKSLKNTIASTLSDKNLAQVYLYMVENQILNIVTSVSNSVVVGSLSYREFNKKNSLKQLIYLGYKSIPGFIQHPIIWAIELYFKIGLYKNINSKVNIVTLFIANEFQNKKVGQLLIDHIINEYKNDITVDTRSNNDVALNFYKKNQFKILNQNFKNTVLKRD